VLTIDQARKLLDAAGVFFEPDEDEPEFKQMLNLNDVWAWACADGEHVADEELPAVAELFYRYGWCGILYWVAEKNGCKSEFKDNNRFIEFVRHEERIRKEVPDSNRRAYFAASYAVGETN